MPSPSFVVLINIPSPYRVHFFHALDRRLADSGWTFSAYFMAQTESGRYWQLDPSDWSFDHQLARGIHPRVSGSTFHFNPVLLKELITHPPDRLLICGGWFVPTIVGAALLLRFSRRTQAYLWSESNLRSIRYRSGLVAFLRKRMLRLFDGFVLPGAWAKEYLEHHKAIEHVRTVYLPNVIDDETYVGKVAELRGEREALRSELDIPKGRDARVLVSLARLEPIKGIMELMRGIAALEDAERGRLHLLIAGDGIQRAELQQFAAQHQLHNVRFMGHLEEMQILQLLAAADAFVLPSLRDPYPLAVVEAAFAALPLLLSHSVGCHPETLDDGVNGWLFDPVDVESTRSALAGLLAADHEQLRRMGQVSHEIAQRGFATQAVVQRFVREITQ